MPITHLASELPSERTESFATVRQCIAGPQWATNTGLRWGARLSKKDLFVCQVVLGKIPSSFRTTGQDFDSLCLTHDWSAQRATEIFAAWVSAHPRGHSTTAFSSLRRAFSGIRALSSLNTFRLPQALTSRSWKGSRGRRLWLRRRRCSTEEGEASFTVVPISFPLPSLSHIQTWATGWS